MSRKQKDNLDSLLKIKNSTSTSADLYFYGDIVSSWWGAWEDADQYPDKVKDFLDEAKGKDLNIYINSGGGNVMAGMAIYNMLKRHNGTKTVYVDGLAGSIASVIALAGDKVVIPSNAYYMIHKPWIGVEGNSTQLREYADLLDKVEEGLVMIYQENLKDGVNIEDIKSMMEAETWMTGKDASEYFNIEVSQGIDAVACVSDYYEAYKKVPKILDTVTDHIKEKNEIEDLLLELELI